MTLDVHNKIIVESCFLNTNITITQFRKKNYSLRIHVIQDSIYLIHSLQDNLKLFGFISIDGFDYFHTCDKEQNLVLLQEESEATIKNV